MKNVIKLQTNEILEANATYYGEDMKDKIKRDVLHDYSKGIKTARLNVFPKDTYYSNGGIAKTWNMGELINVNDIIRVLDKDGNAFLKDSNGNDVYFKVIDRQVSYEGQVLINFQLQEVKII